MFSATSARSGVAGRRRVISFVLFALSVLAPASPWASVTIPVLGFEDDVDLVVPVTRQFMLVPTESEDGDSAELLIVDLDPATGVPLDADDPAALPVLGFENGVDPFVLDYGATLLAFVPTETESGGEAELRILALSTDGSILDEVTIELGSLGFAPDLDGIASQYPRGVAFFLLESEDHTERAILAIDSDPTDGDWGACSLVATGAAAGCAEAEVVDWLGFFAPGVDPIAYEMDTSVRLAVPVVLSSGGADLLLVDFESDNVFTDEPPHWQHTMISVKGVNAAGARPTPFPGFEIDVDLALFAAGPCGGATRSLLVPIEAPAGGGDLYLLDAEGVAQWVYSIDGDPSVPILGYERGVDVVPVCASGFSAFLVSAETADGSDADLLIVDAATGSLVTHLEDQAVNPGMTVTGFEVGVEPVPWKSYVVLPMEDAAGEGALVSFKPRSGAVQSGLSLASVGGAGWGFARSVDLIAAQTSPTTTGLYVPIAKEATSDANVLFCQSAPDLVPVTLEMLNGIDLRGLEWDVDLGVVEKTSPGQSMVALPEEDATGESARLRFEDVPSVGPYVVLASGSDWGPPRLDFFRAADAHLAKTVMPLLGLETGLDLAAGSGSLETFDPPGSHVPSNFAADADSDPTLGWLEQTVSVGDAGATAPSGWFVHGTPYAAGAPIHLFSLGNVTSVEIFDASGRRVRTFHFSRVAGSSVEFSWDGKNDARTDVSAGVYFLHAAGLDEASSRLVLAR